LGCFLVLDSITLISAPINRFIYSIALYQSHVFKNKWNFFVIQFRETVVELSEKLIIPAKDIFERTGNFQWFFPIGCVKDQC